MKKASRIGTSTQNRSLVAGGIVFVGLFLYQLCVVPLFPVLDEPLLDVLFAAMAAAAASWIAFHRGRD